MTLPVLPYIPDTAPFSTEQRAWLNGFLAGLFSQQSNGNLPQMNGAPTTPANTEPLLILYGSQTGTAEGLAKQLAKDSQSRGFAPKVLALNDYESANLTAANKVVIISSTWGDGEPPDNAANFWSWISADSAPRLENLNFAVLGLGDRNYSDFCGASKKFDDRLESLGAKRLVVRGECDVDYETDAKKWIDGLWEKLGGAGADDAQATSSFSSLSPLPVGEGQGEGKTSSAYSRINPYPAKLLKNTLLNRDGSSKEVRHYEIELNGSGLTYEAGDSLGVVPVNCPELVEDIITALNASPDENVKVGDTIVTLREALTHQLDITKPSRDLLAAVARAVPQSDLASLLASERNDDLKKWLWGRQTIDVLHLLPTPMAAAEFVSLLKKLTARLYSISSSPKAHPGEVHLTVSAVRYESHGRGRKGVASTFLADRIGDADYVKVYVQPSHGFKPPTNGDAPMIMVGPGTGIAPFRAFLEERQATGARGKNWLFFGDQKRASDFLYEEQLTVWQQDGFLTHLDLAFSRDQQEKIYVQDRMLQNAAELWSWLEAGGHFYVCGDASRMAKDVDVALHKIIESAGGKSPDEAKAYVNKLKSDKRYQRDVY